MSDETINDPSARSQVDAIGAAAVLDEPIRRTLFEHVSRSEAPVDRDEAAAAAGIGRPLAAFHLDRLVRAGLLEVEFRRRSGRSGPGAGRPAKFYLRARGLDIDLSLPDRRYRLAAEILADGVERRADAAVADAVRAAARDRGVAIGAAAAASADPGARGPAVAETASTSARRDRATLRSALDDAGFEPVDDGGDKRLLNCPFDSIAIAHRDLTCPMNLALVQGVIEGIGDSGFAAVAVPADGTCCVRVIAS
jgi:predicted ArsR family transcriptional regulator